MKSLKLVLPVFIFTVLIPHGSSNNNLAGPVQTIHSPSEKTNSTWSNAVLESHTQTATFNANSGLTFSSRKGVSLYIPGGCLTFNGNIVRGQVKLSYIELFDKGNMAATNKSIIGLDSLEDKKMLISGGEFLINVTKGDKKLELTCGNLQMIVPGNLTGGVDKNVILWHGITGKNGDFVWARAKNDTTQKLRAGSELFTEGGNYYILLSEFGWTNIARFYSRPRPETNLSVRFQKGYRDKNSSVYLSNKRKKIHK